MNELLTGIVLGLLASGCWGVADFLARDITRRYGDLESLFGVLLVGCLGVALYTVPRGAAAPPHGEWPLVAATALLAVAGYAALYRALKEGVLSVVSPIASANAVIPVLLALVVLGERPLPWQYGGILAVMAGVALLSVKKGIRIPAGTHSLGVGPALVCVLLFGLSLFGMKLSVERIDPGAVALWVRVIGVGALFLWLLASRRLTPPPADVRLPLLTAGVLDAAAFIFFCEALTHTLLSLVAPVSSTIPLFTVTLAWVFLHERLGRIQWAGFALTVAGIAAVAVT